MVVQIRISKTGARRYKDEVVYLSCMLSVSSLKISCLQRKYMSKHNRQRGSTHTSASLKCRFYDLRLKLKLLRANAGWRRTGSPWALTSPVSSDGAVAVNGVIDRHLSLRCLRRQTNVAVSPIMTTVVSEANPAMIRVISVWLEQPSTCPGMINTEYI
jgi:hypothetical protein